jgi:membrane associated rhomboid family serine protease
MAQERLSCAFSSVGWLDGERSGIIHRTMDRDPVLRAFRAYPVATVVVIGIELAIFIGALTILSGNLAIPIWAAINGVIGAFVVAAVWRRRKREAPPSVPER